MPPWLRRCLWPASLSGRIALILFGGLAAAHGMSFWLVVMERGLAVRGMMVSYLATDIASSVAMLERLPAGERPDWLPRLARRNYGFRLQAAAPAAASQSELALAVGQAVTLALGGRAVDVLEGDGAGTPLRIGLRLADGGPLTIDLRPAPLEVSPWIFSVLALQLVLLAGLSALAVRVATRPLRDLARAAAALDPAATGAPLAVQGPSEVASAAQAFNAMQDRIRAHLDERMHILAAVSHDLQTPITRLRLRADLLDDEVLRGKLHADLAEMQALVAEGIAYARSAHAVREPEQPVDMAALLDTLACDYADAGQPVRLADVPAGRCVTRPMALRRLLGNLVDNALKFAGTAEIHTCRDAEGGWSIDVLDRGPGIAAAELVAVRQPFHRIEDSRNRSTGGTGLGLAIASQLAVALGGDLRLAPRAGGGLSARLCLPPTGQRPNPPATDIRAN